MSMQQIGLVFSVLCVLSGIGRMLILCCSVWWRVYRTIIGVKQLRKIMRYGYERAQAEQEQLK